MMYSLKKYLRRTALVAGAVLIALVLLFSAWFFWGGEQHETNLEAISMAVSQAELDEVSELHTEVEGEPVIDVLGTDNGALLVLEQGVVALSDEQWTENRDGQWDEQWRYLDRTPLAEVEVLPKNWPFAPNNGTVALTYGQAGERDHSVVLLNSRTGEFRGRTEFGDRFTKQDELHLSPIAVLQHSGQTLTSYPLGRDEEVFLPSQEHSWTLTMDELCPGTTEPGDEEPRITASSPGFMVSLRCVDTENEKQTHVVSHLDSQKDTERWRLVWEDVDPDAPHTEVHYMSSVVIPDSPQDVFPELLDGDNSTPYALVLDSEVEKKSEYHEPNLFRDWDSQGYFSVPLQDQADYPEILILGNNDEIGPHISMQSAKILLDDPEVEFEREDVYVLRWWHADQAWAEPRSYRAYSTINFTLQLNHAIQTVLS